MKAGTGLFTLYLLLLMAESQNTQNPRRPLGIECSFDPEPDAILPHCPFRIALGRRDFHLSSSDRDMSWNV